MLKSSTSISLLGCGWIGEPLAIYLHELNYSVKVSTRSSEATTPISSLGIEHFQIDIDKNAFNPEFFESDVLIIAIPSKNIEGYTNLLSYLEKYEFKSIIFVSSTSVYEFSNQTINEESTLNTGKLAQIEKLFLESKHNVILLRYAGLFGYNRMPHQFISTTRKMSKPNGYINLVHRDDCIQIMAEILTRDLKNEIFNVCASTHPNRRVFYTQLAKLHQRPMPLFDTEDDGTFKLIDNSKVKNALNYTFIHDDLTLLYDKSYEY